MIDAIEVEHSLYAKGDKMEFEIYVEEPEKAVIDELDESLKG